MDKQEFSDYAADYKHKLDQLIRTTRCFYDYKLIDEKHERHHFTIRCVGGRAVTWCLYLDDGVPSWSRING